MVIQGSNNDDSSNDEVSSQNQNSSCSSNRKRKGRGLAKKTPNWGKKQLIIEFDVNGNPCGGKYKKFATQLGCFVRDGTSFPLTTESWDQMDEFVIERIWTDIQSNTNVPLHSKQYCIDSMGDKWRDWKCRVKKRGFYAYDTDEERLANCPIGVVENQWPLLVSMWGKEEIQNRANINRGNRLKQDFLHHLGKKSMAVFTKDVQQRSDKGLPNDRLNVFIASREGAKDITTRRMLETLREQRDELKETNQDTPEELENVFIENLGKDGHGRMRCLGRGITSSMVYGRKSGLQATSAETVAAIRAEFEEKFKIQKQEIEARIKAECKLEMEVQIEAFKQEILSQLQSKIG